MKYVVFYESGDDIATLARAHFPAHRAWFMGFQERGLLLMIGPFADAGTESAMSVFTTREAAEDFVKGDPFVHHGVVPQVDHPRMARSPRPLTPSLAPEIPAAMVSREPSGFTTSPPAKSA